MVKKQYLRIADICEQFGISRSTLWRWRRDGILPPGKKLTPKTEIWLVSDIEAHLEQIGKR
jgi:predicted DNA-binding transcriptional regulator AlpA